jgi:hypothetical protein
MKKPSPALVISLIALFVALSGTSYAVSKLPKNSVGNKQLKKNAVTSKKVKDRSLLARDFKSGQLPAGVNGAKGDKGEKGDAGATGPAGPTAAGFDQSGANIFVDSAGYVALVTIPAAADSSNPGPLQLPAGATVQLTSTIPLANSVAAVIQVHCRFARSIDGGSWSVLSGSDAYEDVPAGPARDTVLPLALGYKVSTAGSYRYRAECTSTAASGITVSAANLTVIGIG